MNEIKCNVTNCIHHCGTNSCDAQEIKVGNTTPDEKTCNCGQTECDTFEAKK